MRFKRGDLVQVITGDYSGPAPRKVIQVLDGGKKLLVEGVNRVYKHVRRGHPKSPQGGRLQMEMPIDSTNVMPYCETCERGVRVGHQYQQDGSKVRVCRKCGKPLGAISPPRARYASKS